MGIFTQSDNYSTGTSSITANDTFESLMESVTEAYEGDDFEEGALDSVLTMNENYNNIMTAIGVTEAVAFERTGKEFIWTEGVLSDFGNKIKSFFKKIWEKIKGLFKRAIAMFDSYTMQDKAFVKKYRKEIFAGKDLSDFTFKGYEFKNLNTKTGDIHSAIKKCAINSIDIGVRGINGFKKYDREASSNPDVEAYGKMYGTKDHGAEKRANKQMEKVEDKIEELRGIVISCFSGSSSSGGKFTSEEFRKEIKEWLHDGETDKQELDNINVTTLTDYLVGSKQTTKTIQDMFKENKKNIDQDIKYVEGLQKDDWRSKPVSGTDEQKDRAAARAVDLAYALRLCRESKEMLMVIDGLVLAALKECSRQYKACLVKIMHYNPKSETYTESYSNNEYYSGNNFLAGIELK